MSLLWQTNRPQDVWHCISKISDEIWSQAIVKTLPSLGISGLDSENMLEMILGEGQFGADRYHLSFTKQVYYHVKPFFPQPLAWLLRRWYSNPQRRNFSLGWPAESRYMQFLQDTMRLVSLLSGINPVEYVNFWPKGQHSCLVLTHDVETAEGQKFIPVVADLEEKLGFRSSFNLIPERYSIDRGLVADLKNRGFEIGIHGLKHDGKLYLSQKTFHDRCVRINEYLQLHDAVGFRSPLTHRQPEWMQSLAIEYDSSFFDTDPFEPMPGGTMSLLPFFIGQFVELPYTLMQDYTLVSFLHETTPHIWLEKAHLIEQYQGMVLLNSHPDYLQHPPGMAVYTQFLTEMKQINKIYHDLPRVVARWWRYRAQIDENTDPGTYSIGQFFKD
ncbi:MAG: hypothetical protein GYA15_10205 [Leptolinea sp.]|nr:hypothetical protein [Leptolinea sp.]